MTQQLPRFSYIKIDPPTAEAWLDRHKRSGFGQRALNGNNLETIARAMRTGKFRADNGEDIKIGPNWEIVDGHHRLTAIVQTGTTFYLGVKFDVPVDAMPTVNVGKIRTVPDMLTIAGGKTDVNLLSGAARLFTAYMNRPGNSIVAVSRANFVSKEDVFERANNDRTLEEVTRLTRAHFRTAAFPNLSAIAFCWRLGRKVLPQEVADEFFLRLSSGTGLYEGDPRLTLRERLINIRTCPKSRGSRVDVSIVIYFILRALSAFAKGEELVRLTRPRADVIEFPELTR